MYSLGTLRVLSRGRGSIAIGRISSCMLTTPLQAFQPRATPRDILAPLGLGLLHLTTEASQRPTTSVTLLGPSLDLSARRTYLPLDNRARVPFQSHNEIMPPVMIAQIYDICSCR